MSSLDVLRERAIEGKKHEIDTALRAQSALLLQLDAVTDLLRNNGLLTSLFSRKYDTSDVDALDSHQHDILRANGLGYGRRFDESSIPFPKISFDHTIFKNANSDAAYAAADAVASASSSNNGVAAFKQAAASQDSMDVSLADIAPPEPEEEAQFDDNTADKLDRQSPKRPAKTVHLPPEEKQEERLHNVTSAKSHLDSHHRSSHYNHAQHDPASSPSSTVGPYSQATPMPPQESPDTSPDSEVAPVEIPPEYRPSTAERKAKEEHDKHLAAQKALAHQAALGDVNTPDDQLRWEEREAAAREAEERRVTLDNNGPEPDADMTRGQETQAEAFAADKQNDAPGNAPQVEDANKTVTTPLARTPLRQQSSPDMNRRRQSTVTRPDSPVQIRRQDTGTGFETSPKHSLWNPPKPTIADAIETAFSDIATLQGAAEDPEKDYLEPLFKIQAHDSPSINTAALPDLLRTASKTISTIDQFTAMHERMDYRILRRIYHLQNANKWSLRQMEKWKEPEQPISHQDHLVAEMKWLSKDFRAERKRKKHICAWLAARCAEWVAADADTRLEMQIRVKSADSNDEPPELDEAAETPIEDDTPATPKHHDHLPTRITVDPDLMETVSELQRNGGLARALKQIPVWAPEEEIKEPPSQIMSSVSKFVQGKVLPKIPLASKKRSRYDYENEDEGPNKRPRQESDLLPEEPDIAIFHQDNKSIRDRLHAQNAFRPPSEFQMPTVPFYEFRNGSAWIVEDDQKLRRLAREHTFNWSIISDQMSLPSRFRSGLDRRTPWECFERWVELEQMPAEMRKTQYFKTWYTRLEQAQQNVEKRFQAQQAIVQAQAAQTGITPQHQPMRRRTQAHRVEKRKNTRYLWTVDAMRKNAKKRELAAYKQAEATRAAVQRKASQQAEGQPSAPRQQMLTPQQFSQKRYERDLQAAEQAKINRAKMVEQYRQQQAAKAAQQGLANGPAAALSAQQQASIQATQAQLAQLTPQQRQQQLQMAARTGQLAINGNPQSVPQAQMGATTGTAQQQNMQRMAAQMQAQRSGQFTNQQHAFAMQNGNVASPGSAVSAQQQMQSNAALLAAYQQQQQKAAQNGSAAAAASMVASGNMAPPPAPQQLSSGLVPVLTQVKNSLRAKYPTMSEEQLQQHATEYLLKSQESQRQNAMAAAAGTSVNGTQAYSNQQGYNGTGTATPQANGTKTAVTPASQQQAYANLIRQRQLAQMQAASNAQAVPNGSPNMQHASPNMTPVSPAMQYSNMAVNGQQRPSSRSATPQMQRLGSSGTPGVVVPGMQSPGAPQSSPRMQASAAR